MGFRITFTVSKEHRDVLRQRAIIEGRSVSNCVAAIIARDLSDHKNCTVVQNGNIISYTGPSPKGKPTIVNGEFKKQKEIS